MTEGKSKVVDPVLCEQDGTVMARSKMNGIMKDALHWIKSDTNLIPNEVDNVYKYSIH